jgi:hypothetical protein
MEVRRYGDMTIVLVSGFKFQGVLVAIGLTDGYCGRRILESLFILGIYSPLPRERGRG